MLAALRPGAAADEIADLEHTIGCTLPADVRRSLTIHNGQQQQPSGFFFGLELLDAVQIAAAWREWAAVVAYNSDYHDEMESYPKGAVRLEYVNAGWIPLTSDAGANHLGIDTAPGAKGRVGQVINFGRNDRLKCVLADSWGAFLQSYAALLASEQFLTAFRAAESWDATFDRLFATVAVDGRVNLQHPHDALVGWRKTRRWPLK